MRRLCREGNLITLIAMMKKMCGVHKVAWVLLVVGGLNWLLVGLLGRDVLLLSLPTMIVRAVYILIGLAALSAFGVGRCCMKDTCTCGQKGCPACDMKAMQGKLCDCGRGKKSEECCKMPNPQPKP
jgi:uncharacterized membrane protein YuzA (DUF378 family)